MNKTQMKKLLAIAAKISEAQQEAQEVIEELEEQWDAKSEKWQESAVGQEASDFKSQLEDVISIVEFAHDQLSGLVDL